MAFTGNNSTKSISPSFDPQSLIRQHQSHFGVKVIPYQGSQLQVTSFEITLYRLLDRPLLTGEWEEIWRSLESGDCFDIERIP